MICFVIAMESEAAPVLKNMQLSSTENKCGKKLYRGTLCGEDTAVIVCGVGKVNAACGAQFMCDNFAPKAIINIGVAGGLNATMRAGEIYSISSACQYDFDLVQLNGTPIGTLNEFTERLLPLSVTGGYAEKILATGDRFNDDKKDFELLTEDIHADIRDMEGGAIAQVCIHAGVKFYSFKAISDIAGSGSTTEQFLANTALCAKNLEREIPHIFGAVKADIAK
ncbi:MAG TPA: 5'-methylthioadenosine/S-adenosylhomocysteine nucleosidase [Candidatus Coproplasma excrementavium]|nr:5'-methylthioadenosine/S-adenosylhomocysteine nucleosidase [Candidatus Coproplasma excrementavium]